MIDRLFRWAWIATAIAGFGGGVFLGSTGPIASLRFGRLDADLAVRCATLLVVWCASAAIGYGLGFRANQRELREVRRIALDLCCKNTEMTAGVAKLRLMEAAAKKKAQASEPPVRVPNGTPVSLRLLSREELR